MRRRSAFLLATSVALTTAGVGSEAAADVPPPAPHALGCRAPVGRVVTCASYTPGETWFTVPAGVRAVHVRLVGARGGLGVSSFNVWDEESDWTQESFADAAGGRGAELQGDLAVGAGVLHLHVGGPGADGGFDPPRDVPGATGRGGVNGGGDAGGLGNGRFRGGAGGGASDLRVGGDALSNRVMVAGGGGGAGAGSTDVAEGGDHDQDATLAGRRDPCAGGSGHSRRAGVGDIDGLPGRPGLGGAGAPDDENDYIAGGGGGGGYGGGGGGAMAGFDGCGGGGGSSYFNHRRYAVRGTASTLWTTTAPPSVTLTYLLPRG